MIENLLIVYGVVCTLVWLLEIVYTSDILTGEAPLTWNVLIVYVLFFPATLLALITFPTGKAIGWLWKKLDTPIRKQADYLKEVCLLLHDGRRVRAVKVYKDATGESLESQKDEGEGDLGHMDELWSRPFEHECHCKECRDHKWGIGCDE